MKKILNFFILLLLLILATVLLVTIQWPDDYTHVIFCDVGQGDAILISNGFWQALVDGGPNDEVLFCLNRHMPLWDRNIELVVATHADQDHINGLIDVLKQYRVSNLLISDHKDTATFNSFARIIENRVVNDGMKLLEPILGQEIRLSDVFSMQILAPNNQEMAIYGEENQGSTETILSDILDKSNQDYLSSNDRSIVLLLTINKVGVMLMGDLEQSGELALIDKGLTAKTSVVKIGHHGAKTSTNMRFLEEVQPELGVISCAENNKFSHPDPLTLENLSKIGVKIHRTDLNGELELISDGEKYWLVQEN
jgi:competence protein ComEC